MKELDSPFGAEIKNRLLDVNLMSLEENKGLITLPWWSLGEA